MTIDGPEFYGCNPEFLKVGANHSSHKTDDVDCVGAIIQLGPRQNVVVDIEPLVVKTSRHVVEAFMTVVYFVVAVIVLVAIEVIFLSNQISPLEQKVPIQFIQNKQYTAL
jgi:hypothetical protein